MCMMMREGVIVETVRPFNWDGGERVPVEELDAEAVEAFVSAAEKAGTLVPEAGDTVADVMECLGLIKDGTVGLAGIMMFHPRPEKFSYSANTRIGRFPRKGEDRVTCIGEPLATRRGKVLEYVESVIDLDIFPRALVEAALTDAVVNGDPTDDMPVSIRIDDAYMWIATYRPRNGPGPLADLFRIMGTESPTQRAMERMAAECEGYAEKPEIEWFHNRFDVSLHARAVAGARSPPGPVSTRPAARRTAP